MNDQEGAARTQHFKDRKNVLTIFGVFQIVTGGFCLLMMLVMLVAGMVTTGRGAGGMDMGALLVAVFFYLLVGTGLVWLGLGSIRCRRWARILVVMFSWLWLAGGLLSIAGVLYFMSDLARKIVDITGFSQMIAAIVAYVLAGVMGFFYVLVPLVHILFYESKNVRATCEHRDPEPSWTEQCPKSVLLFSVTAGLTAVSSLTVGAFGWTFPLFGTILTGRAGATTLLVTCCLWLYIAWGTYRLHLAAWWTAAGLTVAGSLSWAVTALAGGLELFYEKIYTPEQLQLIQQVGIRGDAAVNWFVGLTAATVLVYLWVIKKHFLREPAES